MRTTVTLDPDTEQIIRRRMDEGHLTFKAAVNDAIRSSAGAAAKAKRFRTETASLGVSHVNLDRALQVVAELEDEELVRRTRAGK